MKNLIDDVDLEKKLKEREERKKNGELEKMEHEITQQSTFFVGDDKDDEDLFCIKNEGETSARGLQKY
jgi:trehalose-6-phosphatase